MRIVAAALRFKNGSVSTGINHIECWWKAFYDGIIKENPAEQSVVDFVEKYGVEEGFVTDTGRFVDRDRAFQIAVAARQVDSSMGWLDAGELDAEEMNESLAAIAVCALLC